MQKLVPQSEGEPIAEGERHELESAFGQNLSEVRIHRDGEAGELAEAAGANAVTARPRHLLCPGAVRCVYFGSRGRPHHTAGSSLVDFAREDASMETSGECRFFLIYVGPFGGDFQ